MRYDPSVSALIHPELQPPLGPNWPWNEAAILAECARLAYIRFENGGEAEETLKNALATFGYGDLVGFFAKGEQIGKYRFDIQASQWFRPRGRLSSFSAAHNPIPFVTL
jgi:hypothetical protein